MRIEKRFYQTVSAASSSTSDWTIPNNSKFYMDRVGGNSSVVQDVKVEVVWDPVSANEILFATHSSSEQKVEDREFVGDGSKVIRIKLTNDTQQAETIGAVYAGELYE